MDVINIIVLVLPDGKELEVELPGFSTGSDIIEELLEAEVAPRKNSDGNDYEYDLIYKKTNKRLGEDKSLKDAGVKDGDTLIFSPKMEAGIC